MLAGSHPPTSVMSWGAHSPRQPRCARSQAASSSYPFEQSSPSQLQPDTQPHVVPRKNTPKAASQAPTPPTSCGSQLPGAPALPPAPPKPPLPPVFPEVVPLFDAFELPLPPLPVLAPLVTLDDGPPVSWLVVPEDGPFPPEVPPEVPPLEFPLPEFSGPEGSSADSDSPPHAPSASPSTKNTPQGLA